MPAHQKTERLLHRLGARRDRSPPRGFLTDLKESGLARQMRSVARVRRGAGPLVQREGEQGRARSTAIANACSPISRPSTGPETVDTYEGAGGRSESRTRLRLAPRHRLCSGNVRRRVDASSQTAKSKRMRGDGFGPDVLRLQAVSMLMADRRVGASSRLGSNPRVQDRRRSQDRWRRSGWRDGGRGRGALRRCTSAT